MAFRNSYSQQHGAIEALADAGRRVEAGDVLAYDEMKRVTGMDVLRNRHVLNQARLKLGKEGIYFSPVRGVGLRRFEAIDHLLESGRGAKSVRRKAKKMNTMLTQTQIGDLTKNEAMLVSNHAMKWMAFGLEARQMANEAPKRTANPSPSHATVLTHLFNRPKDGE